MPSDEFHVKLYGLTSREIADYGMFTLPCQGCNAKPGSACAGHEDSSVCKARFTDAVRELAAIAARAVATEVEWVQSCLQDGGEPAGETPDSGDWTPAEPVPAAPVPDLSEDPWVAWDREQGLQD